MNRTFLSAVCILSSLSAAACGSDEGEPGTVQLTVWGEEYIEEEIPADVFADGWTVHFETFLVVIGDVTVAGGPGSGASLPSAQLLDLVTPGPHDLGSLELDSGAWEDVSYATPAI